MNETAEALEVRQRRNERKNDNENTSQDFSDPIYIRGMENPSA